MEFVSSNNLQSIPTLHFYQFKKLITVTAYAANIILKDEISHHDFKQIFFF
jgi:hypothetical protein